MIYGPVEIPIYLDLGGALAVFLFLLPIDFGNSNETLY